MPPVAVLIEGVHAGVGIGARLPTGAEGHHGAGPEPEFEP